jgi:hypothetical protein
MFKPRLLSLDGQHPNESELFSQELAHFLVNFRQPKRILAKIKEVVVNVHLVDIKHLLPTMSPSHCEF